MSCKNCNTNCIEAGTRDDQMCSAWTKRNDAVATDKNVAHKTNADRIRSMTDEELAEWFCTMCNFGDFCPYKDDCDTNGSGILKWMKEEVKDV